MTAVVIALKNELTAIPPSNKVAIENLPPTLAIRKTTVIAIIEPINAPKGKKKADSVFNPKAMTNTAPAAPPLDTPIMPGSAMELRNNACMTPPEIPSAAPTINARNILGSRML